MPIDTSQGRFVSPGHVSHMASRGRYVFVLVILENFLRINLFLRKSFLKKIFLFDLFFFLNENFLKNQSTTPIAGDESK